MKIDSTLTKKLPSEVVYCKKCVISNQRPSSVVEFKSNIGDAKPLIAFNKDGVCSACEFHSEKEINIDWENREKNLRILLDRFRKKDGGYDIVIPGSGGKDSAFTAHILKYKYGMNPLTVTWAPHLYTDIGWKNFDNWIKVGGFDNLLFTPNARVHSVLSSIAFKNLLHPFQPFIIGQKIIGPLFAKKFNVKLIMYGENQAEYGNLIDENKTPKMDSQFFSVLSKEEMLFGGIPMKEIMKEYNFSLGDFEPYIPPSAKDLDNSGIEMHYLGYYLKWDPQEMFYYASENTGFSANTERTQGSYSKYIGIDDKMDTFHWFTTLIKFGIGRATYDAAQEIRNDKITREEGIALIKKYDTEFPHLFFEDFLKYLQIDEDIFWKTIDTFRPSHLWKKENNEWKLKNPIWLQTK
tara:strand:- start:1479 stop:2702 length:1224 start_codon:yes stop_codon:yes gene_type:complete